MAIGKCALRRKQQQAFEFSIAKTGTGLAFHTVYSLAVNLLSRKLGYAAL